MRLVQVAKALGMTGQQLRKELETVDFGIKPTDREIPDNLAQGVVRFVARKHNITVNMEELGFSLDEDEKPVSSTAEDAEEKQEQDAEESDADKDHREQLHVLRKLTLDDVSQDAIKKQKKKLSKSPLVSSQKRQSDSESKPSETVEKKEQDTMQKQEQIKKKVGVVTLPAQVTVKEFAEKTGIQMPTVMQALLKNGVMATITQSIDFDTASIVAVELGVEVKKEHESASAEDLHARNLEELTKDEPENLKTRPPIVVIMGHVDHGKTSILDAIRQTDVVSQESGGITQHIGAYQVEYQSKGSKDKHAITFLDTPGHEAFTTMRARGAQTTDIAIIVVAADEGIKQTTKEAISHAKDAEVPILVAINKVDKENADVERVKGELSGEGLQPEDWGGDIPTVLCSALTKQGIDDILDHILLLAELHPCTANPHRPGIATVIESHHDAYLGAQATVIINTGSLALSQPFACGQSYGKVRTMMDARGNKLKTLGPSGVARISGFSDVPQVGDILQILQTEQQARLLVEQVKEHDALQQKRSFTDLVSRLSEGKLTQLKIVLKADAQGSIEALQESLAKQATDEVAVKIIHSGIGAVSESDVMMAAASDDAVVVAFHAQIPSSVRHTADREGVEIREYDTVYALFEDIEALLGGLLEPEEQEIIVGHIDIRGVFLTKKNEQIVGGKVTDGLIKRLPFRVQRNGEEVGTGRITSLKHIERDIKEAKEGTECGMRIETSISIEEGDIFEVFRKDMKRKEGK